MFTLTRETIAVGDAIANQQSWPLRIVAAATGAADPAVFVYHAAAAPLASRDFFSCVASAPQMTELPVDAPSPGLPFYRADSLLVFCRSAEHAAEFWTKIRRAVQSLTDNLQQAEVLSVEEVVTITPTTSP